MVGSLKSIIRIKENKVGKVVKTNQTNKEEPKTEKK